MDIELLRKQLIPFRKQVTTPHSETSNFIEQAPQTHRTALVDQFRLFVHETAEVYTAADVLVETSVFHTLGLTDSAILQLSDKVAVLTMDYELSGKILALGGHTINFNHLRSRQLLPSR